MNTIHRNLLNQDLIYDNLDYVQLNSMIDYWKVLLWEKYNLRPNDVISLIVSSTDIYYISAVIACLELGIAIAITDKSVNKNHGGVRQRLYGTLKLALFDQAEWNNKSNVEVNSKFFNQVDCISIFNTYKIQDNSLWNEITGKVFANKDTIALVTTTSGTTGTPTVIKRSHEWILESSIRAINCFNFKKFDTVLHARQLSHGAVLDLFLLPSLMVCDRHVVCNYDNNNVEELVNIIDTEKVNKCMLFSAKQEIFDKLPKLTHKFDVFVGSKPDYSWLAIMQEKNIHSITVVYGSTEAGNAILLSTITQETDPSTFDPCNYGNPVDDRYQLRILPTGLEVTIPKFNQTVVNRDKFELRNGQYYFCGRYDAVRINEVFVKPSELENIVKQHTDQEFDVVIDEDYQEIYLALYNNYSPALVNDINKHIAQDINEHIKISKAEQLDIDQFRVPGYKVAKDVIRNHFRSNFDSIHV